MKINQLLQRPESRSVALTRRRGRGPREAEAEAAGGIRPRGRGGFTIAELLVSLIVTSIGVVGFVSAVGVMTKELWYGKRDTEVALLVADQMERLKSTPYDSLQSGTRIEGDYQLSWAVQGADPKKVVLVASYSGRNGPGRADTLVNYVLR